MAKNTILKALVAGLGAVGKGIEAKEAEERQSELDARQKEKEDREYELRKQSAETANDLARQEMMLNKIRLNTQQIANTFAVSQGDPTATLDAVNQYGNIPRKLQIDPTNTDGNQITYVTGKWVPKGDGTFEKNEDGTFKFVADKNKDGSNKSVTTSRDEFNRMVALTIKPENQLALMLAKDKLEMGEQFAIRAEKRQEEADIRKINRGVGAAGKIAEATGEKGVRAAQEKLYTAQAEAAGRKDLDKIPTQIKSISGEMTKVSKEKSDQLINDVKSLKELYPGITTSEAYRMSEVLENPDILGGVDTIAQQVISDKLTQAEAVKRISKAFGFSKDTAVEMLNKHMQGIDSGEPWYKFWK